MPSYSITSSAPTSRPGGTVRPSAFAVLRLIDCSYLLGVCYRKIGGLRAPQDAVNIGRSLSALVDDVGAVGHEAASRNEESLNETPSASDGALYPR